MKRCIHKHTRSQPANGWEWCEDCGALRVWHIEQLYKNKKVVALRGKPWEGGWLKPGTYSR